MSISCDKNTVNNNKYIRNNIIIYNNTSPNRNFMIDIMSILCYSYNSYERDLHRESKREKRAERLIWYARGDHSQKCGKQGVKGTTRFSTLRFVCTMCLVGRKPYQPPGRYRSTRSTHHPIYLELRLERTSIGRKVPTKLSYRKCPSLHLISGDSKERDFDNSTSKR